jgi:ATPase subunit of ABC transporter with duplicated ATPase domains
MMSRWRKTIQILTLQWFRFHEAIDVVNGTPDDDDVLTEQQLVNSGKAQADRIVIRNLSKVYDDGKVAVDNLSIGIAPGECFGLLGINGKLQQYNVKTGNGFF